VEMVISIRQLERNAKRCPIALMLQNRNATHHVIALHDLADPMAWGNDPAVEDMGPNPGGSA